MKKVNTIIIGLAVVLAFGCGKEKDPAPVNIVENQPDLPACQLREDSSSDGGFGNKYFYAEGKVIRIERKFSGNRFYELIEYDNGGKVTFVKTYGQDSVLASYVAYSHNTNGQVSRLTGFRKSFPGGTLDETGHQDLTYNSNGKLIERRMFGSAQANHPSVVYQYSHQSNGIVVEKYFSDPTSSGNPQLSEITEYHYDNQKNPYAGLSNAIEMNIFTEHNLIAIKVYDAAYNLRRQTTLSHQYNANGFPTSTFQNFNGQQSQFYHSYSCQ